MSERWQYELFVAGDRAALLSEFAQLGENVAGDRFRLKGSGALVWVGPSAAIVTLDSGAKEDAVLALFQRVAALARQRRWTLSDSEGDLPAGEVTQVLERFHRPPSARGSGLPVTSNVQTEVRMDQLRATVGVVTPFIKFVIVVVCLFVLVVAFGVIASAMKQY